MTTQSQSQMTAATEFVITRANGGQRTVVDTYAEALEILRAEGCAEIGHSGDLEDGGQNTGAWLTAADAENDAGQRTYAMITARYS